MSSGQIRRLRADIIPVTQESTQKEKKIKEMSQKKDEKRINPTKFIIGDCILLCSVELNKIVGKKTIKP